MSYHPKKKNFHPVPQNLNSKGLVYFEASHKYACSSQRLYYSPSKSISQPGQDHQSGSELRPKETKRECYSSDQTSTHDIKVNPIGDLYSESSSLFKENVGGCMDAHQTFRQGGQVHYEENIPGNQTASLTNISINTHKHIHMGMPVLKLEVITNDDYNLDETDVIDLFSRYGRVIKVIIKASKLAYIVYNDIMSAFYAQKSLNGLYLKDIGAKLFVNQCDPNQEDWKTEDLEQLQKIQLNAHETLNTWNKEITSVPKRTTRPLPNLPLDIPAFPYTPVKFTCKYEIQIENDKEFQVARRLIGPRGCNMKLILIQCQTLVQKLKLVNEKDLLKLRLRGKGSGFLEGPEKIESEETMHLCVSSKYMEIYNMACVKIEELLMRIYQDYQRFCKKRGRKAPILGLKRLEDYNEPTLDNNNA